MEHKITKNTILIVDDIAENIHVLMETLKSDYAILAATNGEKALKMAEGKPAPDLILLDVMMPGIDGYEVCKRLKENSTTANIPVIFVTALSEEKNEAHGLQLGAVDYITKPFIPELVKSRVHNQIELKKHRDNLEELVKERTRELEITQDVTIYSLANLAETRDNETGGHIKRTQSYVKALAEKLQQYEQFKTMLDLRTIDLLYKSAALHDIGKVGVPDSILLKPGKLTDDEFEIMKKHTTYGRDALLKAEAGLGSNSFLRFAREIAYTHQEKWDGSGYPEGLKGEDIPVSGRIMAIADVYDALISKRVYKQPMTHSKAKEIILEGKGKHFDPIMVDAFLEIEEQFRTIALQFADHEEEREALQK